MPEYSLNCPYCTKPLVISNHTEWSLARTKEELAKLVPPPKVVNKLPKVANKIPEVVNKLKIMRPTSSFLTGYTVNPRDVCGDCQGTNIKHGEGCATCLDCGWSKCG